MTGIEIEISGADKLRRLAGDIRRAARTDLQRDVTKGIRGATKVLLPALRQEIISGGQIPSGFRPLLAGATRTSTSVLTQSGTRSGVRVKAYAVGKLEHRDLAAMNKGRLRHPVFDRRRHWVAQRIPAGVVDKPAKRMQDEVVAQVDKVLDDITDRLARGV